MNWFWINKSSILFRFGLHRSFYLKIEHGARTTLRISSFAMAWNSWYECNTLWTSICQLPGNNSLEANQIGDARTLVLAITIEKITHLGEPETELDETSVKAGQRFNLLVSCRDVLSFSFSLFCFWIHRSTGQHIQYSHACITWGQSDTPGREADELEVTCHTCHASHYKQVTWQPKSYVRTCGSNSRTSFQGRRSHMPTQITDWTAENNSKGKAIEEHTVREDHPVATRAHMEGSDGSSWTCKDIRM